MRKVLALLVVLGVLVPGLAFGGVPGTQIVMTGPMAPNGAYYKDSGVWYPNEDPITTTYLALEYRYDGSNITVDSAVLFGAFKYRENGSYVKRYWKEAFSTTDFKVTAFNRWRVAGTMSFEQTDADWVSRIQGVLFGSMHDGLIRTLAGSVTVLEAGLPGLDLQDIEDIRWNLRRTDEFKTAAQVESWLRARGYEEEL